MPDASQPSVIFITNIPAPYRVAMLNRAYVALKAHGLSLKVLFAAASYKRRSYWQGVISDITFPFRFLNDLNLQIGSEKLFSFGWSLPKILREENPAIVVSAGFSLPSMFACHYASGRNIPFLIYSGETSRQAQRRRAEWLRKPVRKYLLAQSALCIAYGSEARNFLAQNGVAKENIHIAINSIDTENFSELLKKAPPRVERDGFAKPRVLFVGNLQRFKGIEFALHALQLLQSSSKLQIQFDIVGGGPDRERLERLTRELSLTHVTFWGPQPNYEVARFFKKCDFFVFPSLYDIYGLVLVEAAAAGLPIIASKFAGGTIDVVQDGQNGFVVDPTDIPALAQCIRELCLNPGIREEMGRQSLRIVAESVNIQKNAQGFVQAILGCLPGDG
ncbi:glycosyltransferase family 1 protein [candidate division KSB1 bacterium]|nr:MAG: glycosyltransferase family 1 protein [candidate division KSB1 bacterium]MBC6949372.1 glycosyltransferase family 1 protein [candidate division KSB1 bacterium]MCE7945657.1 glycosyltransferase family 1 protein [Chlorobi bacterium CHB1]MDL1876474.1 glycosyltransferase family 4 protein [Cytophagia bacterium CHB2]